MNSSGWQVKTVRLAAGDDQKGVITAQQEHGGHIADAKHCSPGKTIADGIVSTGEPVAVKTADCMPLVLIRGQDSALALHVSRKTLIRGLLDAVPTVINTANISAVHIGPHICHRHFTFTYEGDELRQFMHMFPSAVSREQNVTHVSLLDAVSNYFSTWRIDPRIVQYDKRCTYEDTALPSYRAAIDSGSQKPLDRLLTITSRENE